MDGSGHCAEKTVNNFINKALRLYEQVPPHARRLGEISPQTGRLSKSSNLIIITFGLAQPLLGIWGLRHFLNSCLSH
jgi:hypothetical protein